MPRRVPVDRLDLGDRLVRQAVLQRPPGFREPGVGSESRARSRRAFHSSDGSKPGSRFATSSGGKTYSSPARSITTESPLVDAGAWIASLEQDEIRPVAEAMEQGGRLAAKAKVTDAILDKCKPIAGTPADCIAAIEEYKDAGCTHVMLELWGEDRLEQIRLFGEQVLPHVRG